jgi:hypothetical protein
MTYTYKNVKDIDGSIGNYILRKEDNAFIPKDEANIDYQEYLIWAKTNTTEEAD